jgi:hypothetical protein
VCTLDDDNTQELAISHHIKSLDANGHPGKQHLRVKLDDFHVEGPHGTHQCLVFAPLGRNLTSLRDLFEDKALDKTLLQKFLLVILVALDYLRQAGVVHTGLFSKRLPRQCPSC